MSVTVVERVFYRMGEHNIHGTREETALEPGEENAASQYHWTGRQVSELKGGKKWKKINPIFKKIKLRQKAVA